MCFFPLSPSAPEPHGNHGWVTVAFWVGRAGIKVEIFSLQITPAFSTLKRYYIPDTSGMQSLLQLLPGPCVSWERVQLSGPSTAIFSSCDGCNPWIHRFVDWTLSYVGSKIVIFDRNNAREDVFILTHCFGGEFSPSWWGRQDGRERLYQTLPTHVDR